MNDKDLIILQGLLEELRTQTRTEIAQKVETLLVEANKDSFTKKDVNELKKVLKDIEKSADIGNADLAETVTDVKRVLEKSSPKLDTLNKTVRGTTGAIDKSSRSISGAVKESDRESAGLISTPIRLLDKTMKMSANAVSSLALASTSTVRGANARLGVRIGSDLTRLRESLLERDDFHRDSEETLVESIAFAIPYRLKQLAEISGNFASSFAGKMTDAFSTGTGIQFGTLIDEVKKINPVLTGLGKLVGAVFSPIGSLFKLLHGVLSSTFKKTFSYLISGIGGLFSPITNRFTKEGREKLDEYAFQHKQMRTLEKIEANTKEAAKGKGGSILSAPFRMIRWLAKLPLNMITGGLATLANPAALISLLAKSLGFLAVGGLGAAVLLPPQQRRQVAAAMFKYLPSAIKPGFLKAFGAAGAGLFGDQDVNDWEKDAAEDAKTSDRQKITDAYYEKMLDGIGNVKSGVGSLKDKMAKPLGTIADYSKRGAKNTQDMALDLSTSFKKGGVFGVLGFLAKQWLKFEFFKIGLALKGLVWLMNPFRWVKVFTKTLAGALTSVTRGIGGMLGNAFKKTTDLVLWPFKKALAIPKALGKGILGMFGVKFDKDMEKKKQSLFGKLFSFGKKEEEKKKGFWGSLFPDKKKEKENIIGTITTKGKEFWNKFFPGKKEVEKQKQGLFGTLLGKGKKLWDDFFPDKKEAAKKKDDLFGTIFSKGKDLFKGLFADKKGAAEKVVKQQTAAGKTSAATGTIEPPKKNTSKVMSYKEWQALSKKEQDLSNDFSGQTSHLTAEKVTGTIKLPEKKTLKQKAQEKLNSVKQSWENFYKSNEEAVEQTTATVDDLNAKQETKSKKLFNVFKTNLAKLSGGMCLTWNFAQDGQGNIIDKVILSSDKHLEQANKANKQAEELLSTIDVDLSQFQVSQEKLTTQAEEQTGTITDSIWKFARKGLEQADGLRKKLLGQETRILEIDGEQVAAASEERKKSLEEIVMGSEKNLGSKIDLIAAGKGFLTGTAVTGSPVLGLINAIRSSQKSSAGDITTSVGALEQRMMTANDLLQGILGAIRESGSVSVADKAVADFANATSWNLIEKLDEAVVPEVKEVAEKKEPSKIEALGALSPAEEKKEATTFAATVSASESLKAIRSALLGEGEAGKGIVGMLGGLFHRKDKEESSGLLGGLLAGVTNAVSGLTSTFTGAVAGGLSGLLAGLLPWVTGTALPAIMGVLTGAATMALITAAVVLALKIGTDLGTALRKMREYSRVLKEEEFNVDQKRGILELAQDIQSGKKQFASEKEKRDATASIVFSAQEALKTQKEAQEKLASMQQDYSKMGFLEKKKQAVAMAGLQARVDSMKTEGKMSEQAIALLTAPKEHLEKLGIKYAKNVQTPESILEANKSYTQFMQNKKDGKQQTDSYFSTFTPEKLATYGKAIEAHKAVADQYIASKPDFTHLKNPTGILNTGADFKPFKSGEEEDKWWNDAYLERMKKREETGIIKQGAETWEAPTFEEERMAAEEAARQKKMKDEEKGRNSLGKELAAGAKTTASTLAAAFNSFTQSSSTSSNVSNNSNVTHNNPIMAYDNDRVRALHGRG